MEGKQIAIAAFLFATPVHAQLIPADPGSMWYGATWQLADQLDKTFAELSWATGGALFPCEEWSFNYGPPSTPVAPEAPPIAPPPYVSPPSPPYVPPYVPPPAVPEPSTWVMMLAGLASLLCVRKVFHARV